MTRAEALAEARRRWGEDGSTVERAAMRGTVLQCEVGRIVRGDYIAGESDSLWVLGSGPSWEAAFADADRREKGGAK